MFLSSHACTHTQKHAHTHIHTHMHTHTHTHARSQPRREREKERERQRKRERERERERYRLSCLPIVWHFLFILTHTALEREREIACRDWHLSCPIFFVTHTHARTHTHTHTHTRTHAHTHTQTALQPVARWGHQPLVAGCQQIDFKFMIVQNCYVSWISRFQRCHEIKLLHT